MSTSMVEVPRLPRPAAALRRRPGGRAPQPRDPLGEIPIEARRRVLHAALGQARQPALSPGDLAGRVHLDKADRVARQGLARPRLALGEIAPRRVLLAHLAHPGAAGEDLAVREHRVAVHPPSAAAGRDPWGCRPRRGGRRSPRRPRGCGAGPRRACRRCRGAARPGAVRYGPRPGCRRSRPGAGRSAPNAGLVRQAPSHGARCRAGAPARAPAMSWKAGTKPSSRSVGGAVGARPEDEGLAGGRDRHLAPGALGDAAGPPARGARRGGPRRAPPRLARGRARGGSRGAPFHAAARRGSPPLPAHAEGPALT